MGAPFGNKNAVKGKIFYSALLNVIEDDDAILKMIVQTLIEAAKNGEPWAVKELIDRLDGKAAQPTELKGGFETEILSAQKIQVEFIAPLRT